MVSAWPPVVVFLSSIRLSPYAIPRGVASVPGAPALADPPSWKQTINQYTFVNFLTISKYLIPRVPQRGILFLMDYFILKF